MSGLVWQDIYSTGIPVIDQDHHTLFALIRTLDEARRDRADRDVIQSVLNVLMEYVEGHFQREEMLMQLAHYPDFAAHQDAHATLRAQALSYCQNFSKSGEIAPEELIAFLTEWLLNHIIGVDMHYRPWVEQLDSDSVDLSAPVGNGHEEEEDLMDPLWLRAVDTNQGDDVK